MIKKINYIIFALVAILCFKMGVLAGGQTVCEYKEDIADKLTIKLKLDKINSIVTTEVTNEDSLKMNSTLMTGNQLNECPSYILYQYLNDNNYNLYSVMNGEDIRTVVDENQIASNFKSVKLSGSYFDEEETKDSGEETIFDYNESDCKRKGYVWNKKDGYCNTDNLQYVACGDAYDIPAQVPSLISFAVNLLKIATPIILIIISIITLVKAIASTKEDEIKKAQKSLVRKVMAAVIVFFVISIVQFVILKVADDKDHKSITACLTCFLNNDCKTVKYYKTNMFGEYYCTVVGSNETTTCKNFYKEN